MFEKLLAALRGRPAAQRAEDPAGLYSPYRQHHLDVLYNLCFCDDLDLYHSKSSASDTGFWKTLFADPPDTTALREIADDEAHEGRLRMLAFNRLRDAGVDVPPKILLGVIVEMPLQEGLEVLAAFSDGGIRYLNSSGKVAVVEGANTTLAAPVAELLAAAQLVVDQIGPWTEKRRPPPEYGNVRFSFLVSDGLYFGEGPIAYIMTDAKAGPMWQKATALLQCAVDTVLAAQAG